MAATEHLKHVLSYENLVHAVSGAVVSIKIYISACWTVDRDLGLDLLFYLVFDTFQGSSFALSVFYPLDTARTRLQGK